MSHIVASYITANFSADGSVAGYITVASNTGFAVGAIAYVTQTGAADPTEVIITELVSTNQIGVRKTQGALVALNTIPSTQVTGSPRQVGRSDMSAFTLANAAKITQPNQSLYGSVAPGQGWD